MNSKRLIIVITLLLLLIAIPIHVFAAEVTTAEISFTVKNASSTVVAEAVHNEPMPAQTAFEGVSAGRFEFSFTEPGDYYYKIYQKQSTESNVTFDSTVYEVCISVFVNEAGEFYSVSAVNVEDSSEKTDKIVFENTSSELGSEPSSEPRQEPNSKPSTESATTASELSNSDSNTPQTGDNNNLVLWIVLLLASLFGLTWFLFMWKKRDKHYR